MTDYNDGNWHGWDGGECPVHPKSMIQAVRGHTDTASVVTWPADQFQPICWRDAGAGHSHSIIAFRVIKAHREPRVFWVNEYARSFGDTYATKDEADKYGTERIACHRVVIE